MMQLEQGILEKIRAIPGVAAAGITTVIPTERVKRLRSGLCPRQNLSIRAAAAPIEIRFARTPRQPWAIV